MKDNVLDQESGELWEHWCNWPEGQFLMLINCRRHRTDVDLDVVSVVVIGVVALPTCSTSVSA